MCRMLAKVQQPPSREALEAFREISRGGNVLPGNDCGHGDGWGIAGYLRGALTFFEKSALPAGEDDRFTAAEDMIARWEMDIVLCHVRKASVGDVTEANAHPFRHGLITFAHNGGVKQSERLSTFGLKPEGETDSERFFLNIVGRLESGEAASLKEAAGQTVRFIHENLPYSSISFMLTDGKELLVYRDYRDALRPEETEPPRNWDAYPGYYTLYYSPSAHAVCSQPITVMADDWTLMENKELLVLLPDGFAARERFPE